MTPIGIRQNNPGNIRATPDSFRSYGSPEAGIAATMQNLIAYNDNHGINTINGVVNRWAPSSDNNNVGAYVNDMAQTTGMHPDQPYDIRNPQTLINLATAITKHENGSIPYSQDQFNTAANMTLGGNVSRSSQSIIMPPQMQAAQVIPNGLPPGFELDAQPQQAPAGLPQGFELDAPNQMDNFARPAKAFAAGAIGGFPDLLMLPGKLMSNLAPQDAAARQVPSFTGMARQQLDKWFPTAQSSTDGQRFIEGTAGFGGSMVGGGLAGKMVGGAGELLVPKTAADYAGAAGGSVGAGIANAVAPDNPLVNALLPLVGGLGAGAVAGGIGVTKNAVGQIAQPFMKSGREDIVGNAYRQSAQNPEQAIASLENVPQYVPDSNPMTGAASADYGLLSLQKTLRNQNGPIFADAESAQNTARNIMFDSMAGNKSDIATAKEARDLSTGPMRQQAFANTVQPTMSPEQALRGGFGNSIQGKISQILNSPSGSRETVDKAVSWVKNMIGRESDPEKLYEIRKDINDAIQGKFRDSEKSDFKLAGGALGQIKAAIDNHIESVAPGYKGYLSEYASQSKPINQMETLQDVKNNVMLSAPDAKSGYDFFSQPKWSNVVQKNRDELSKVLSQDQLGKLDLITQDLDRGALVNNPAIRALGSDTQPNQSMAQFLGSVIAGKTKGLSGQVLGWVAKLNEEKINRLMVEAMLDPKLAKQLMEKSTLPKISNFSDSLKRKALQMGIYSTLNSQINR